MELALGPVLYEWKKSDLRKFYDEVASMDVDRVYIGEVVCSKKVGLSPREMEETGRMLEGAGKKVVVSSLAVASNEDELRLVRDVSGLPFPVEANDMSVLNVVDGRKKEVLAGPHITTYNVPSVDFLSGCGIRHVTFPVELPGDSVAYILDNTGIEGEVFVHGKAPLAFSWRCYTSRAFGLTKTGCRHDCARFPEGMMMKNLEGEPVFTINGTSVLSAKVYTLVEFIEDLRDMGVRVLRISPEVEGTAEIVDIFRKRIKGAMGPGEALDRLKALHPQGLCNGWFMGRSGKDYLGRAAPAPA